MTRRSTGLAGLDAQLGGGVPAGSVHLMLGEPMNAHELFAYHFAAGAPKGVRYLTTDRSVEEVQEGLARVGADPKNAAVVALPHKKEWLMPDLKPGFRYVVDDFATMAQNRPFEELYSRLVELRAQARAAEVELLVMATRGLLDDRQATRLQMWADGVMELGFDRQGFGLYPYLKVTKMRGVPDSSRFLLFKETQKGLFMESTRRVF